MKPQFQHEATTSLALWLDHHLTYKAEAYSNKTGNFYYMEDTRLPSYPDDPTDGLIAYSSEYKQWVYDSDAAEAVIPSGAYIDTGDGVYKFCKRGESGMRLDFENGRVLLSGAYFPNNYDSLKVTGSFAVKDVNIYLTDDTEENLSAKFKKFDLIGIPYQIIIGSKSNDEKIEFKEINTDTKNLSLDEIKNILLNNRN